MTQDTSRSTRPAVELELFIDVSCPWCHGALEPTRRLLDELAADGELPALQLRWRFMRLHPMPRDGGMPLEAYYATWGDGSPEAIERARQEVRDYVRGVGVRVDFSRYVHLHDPVVAHRLLAAVRDDGGDDVPSLWSVARALLSANFVHGVDITEDAALRGAVERAGLLVPTRVWERVARDGTPADELADHVRAKQVALDGVPRIVVAGAEIVPAWLDAATVRERLRAAIVDAASPSGS